MQQLCTMCDQFYSDPNKHRVMDCYYYVGCPCGIKPASKEHIKGCFFMRERARKKAMQKSAFMGNRSADDVQFNCIYCFRSYGGSTVEEHEKRFCYYTVGCPFCLLKKKDIGHVRNCKSRATEKSMEDTVIVMVCQYCRADVKFEDWDEHKRTRCGPDSGKTNLSLIVDETQKQSQPKQNMMWCAMCGTYIVDTYFKTHQARDRELLQSKFSSVKIETGELPTLDRRQIAGILGLPWLDTQPARGHPQLDHGFCFPTHLAACGLASASRT